MNELILSIEKLSNKTWIDYVIAFAPLVLSIVAIGISVYSIKIQNKIALLDKRLAIYTDLKKCIANIIVEGKVTTQNANMFIISSRDVKFLFGNDAEKLCEEIYDSMNKLRRVGKLVEAGINGSQNAGNHIKNCDDEELLLNEMMEYSKRLEKAFYPYIGLKKIKKEKKQK